MIKFLLCCIIGHKWNTEFYFAADFLGMVTGEWYEVDHVVPLQGKNVCGLHCEQNMQVITRTENRSKGDRWHSN